MSSTAKPPSRLLLGLTGAATALMHALPIGIVQFADYASDVGVILTFFESGDSVSGRLGLGCIIASVAAVWLATLVITVGTLCDTGTVSKKDWRLLNMMAGSALLAPLNLHTLYLASVVARSQARLKTLAAASKVSSEKWQVYDAAQEALAEAYRYGTQTQIKSANQAVKAAKEALEFQEYFDELDLSGAANLLFVLSKAVETALEALPLSVLTASALFSDELPDSFGLFASSLGLSLLSMAYGLFGCCCMVHGELKDDDEVNQTKGRQGTIFTCILIQVSWTIYAMGVAYDSLGAPWRYLFPGAVFGLFFVFLGLPLTSYAIIHRWREESDFSGKAACGIFWIFLFASVVISFESCPIDFAIMLPSSFYTRKYPLSTVMIKFGLPGLRRLLLISMAGWGIASNYGPIRTSGAICGGLLDLLASGVLLRGILGDGDARRRRFCPSVCGACFRAAKKVHPNPEAVAPTAAAPAAAPAQASSLTEAKDMLEAVSRLVASATKSVQAANEKEAAATTVLHPLLVGLKEMADTLLHELPTSSSEKHVAVSTAVKAYLPSQGDPDKDQPEEQWYPAERTLLQRFTALQGSDEAVSLPAQADGAAPAAESQWQHPVRVTRLLFALMTQIWTTTPSFFGKVPTGTCYDLSYEAQRCTYFVSHSWRDGGRRKVQMLREFLFLQALVGRTLVISLVLAVFLLPFGLALDGFFAALPVWAAYVPSAIPLGLLACVLLSTFLSLLGLVPSAMSPWALSTSTIWIDKTGIDQSSPEKTAAGVAAFPRILASCDKFVGLISPGYFRRLWCVYELATFTHMHGMHQVDAPSGKMLLLSLDWPSSFSPFKRKGLTKKEREWITGFRCRDAGCFKPSDRAIVLQAVRDKFGSEDKFDEFVHVQLLKVLERSKREYSSKLWDVGSESFSMVFGA